MKLTARLDLTPRKVAAAETAESYFRREVAKIDPHPALTAARWRNGERADDLALADLVLLALAQKRREILGLIDGAKSQQEIDAALEGIAN